jgi:L-2-hydroxyglutarate oxidase LhgO
MADLVVVGGGIVGMAIAAEALRRDPGAHVDVLEKEPRVAAHQSSHNTGVIHAGVYYAPGSLKARLCVEGNALMYDYCRERGIRHEQRGKLIVATHSGELAYLDELYERGRRNVVPGIARLDAEQLAELEPGVSGIAAVLTPSTGIVSYREVTESLARDVEQAGGRVRLSTACLGVERRGRTTVVRTTAGEVEARQVITCCGLHSDRVARASGASGNPQILPFRGSYAGLVPEAVTRLNGHAIYPVPRPEIPMFLGVHVTPQISGEMYAGPTAVLATSREGYRLRDVRVRDLWESVRFPGFRKLMRNHLRAALEEAVLEIRPELLARHLRPMVPWIEARHFVPRVASGVRAQAMGADGTLLDDFALDRQDSILHVRNAPSPAATSSLALARHLLDEARRGQAEAAAAPRGTHPYG